MDRERWKRAQPDQTVRHHPLRDATVVAVAALVVGVPVALTGSGLAVAIVTPLAAILAYFLSATWERIWNYAREPIHELETRIRDLEARPSNAAPVSAPDRPAPDFRPEIRAANEMLDQEHGDHGMVDGWISSVYDRLFAWNVAIALEFRPAQMVPTAESVARRNSWTRPPNSRPPLSSVLGMLNNPAFNEPSPPALEFDLELVRLRTFRDRLIRLVPQ